MEENSELISKFSHIFIMLHYSIMSNDLKRVKSFLSDEVYNYYQQLIDNNIKNKEIEMFDELNVKSIEIMEKNDLDDRYQVKVKLTSRYMDYFVDSDTLKYKRGINDHRIEKQHLLVFEKQKLNASTNVITCPSCGANLNVNSSSVCPYCNSNIDLTGTSYKLISLQTLSF